MRRSYISVENYGHLMYGYRLFDFVRKIRMFIYGTQNFHSKILMCQSMYIPFRIT